MARHIVASIIIEDDSETGWDESGIVRETEKTIGLMHEAVLAAGARLFGDHLTRLYPLSNGSCKAGTAYEIDGGAIDLGTSVSYSRSVGVSTFDVFLRGSETFTSEGGLGDRLKEVLTSRGYEIKADRIGQGNANDRVLVG